MTKINIDKDCGNSPKHRSMLEFTIAYTKRKLDYLEEVSYKASFLSILEQVVDNTGSG